MLRAIPVAICCAAAIAPAGALRDLAVDGNTAWAVGDAGAILRSDDAGRSWRRLQPPLKANYQSVYVGPEQVFVFGGRAVPGHPTGAGLPTILRTADAGKTFQLISGGPAGWLYGGCFAGRTGVAYGQAGYAAGGGVLHTIDGGGFWAASSVASRGFCLDGDFTSPRYGYVVGQDHRIVSLRNLAEPFFHPPRVASQRSLRAVRFADGGRCWCVGDDAAIFQSRPGRQPWDPVTLTLPPGAKRCADLEAVAFASPRQAWVAGGLIGVVPFTTNGGGSWRLQPAPPGGALHALACLDARTLLAAGDGDRVWRSEDAGASWRLVHGRERTDVLFVLAAGETSCYPAIAAHARAGESVAVVYATHLPSGDGTPPDQPLRAAAIEAGAGGVSTLSEFPSIVLDPTAGGLAEDDILRRWSEPLDIRAEGEMRRQLAAAIRLYRPRVLAVGPDGAGARGPAAENHLVSRLAQQAAKLAGEPGAFGDLAKAGLAPWSVRRVFVGLPGNEVWAAPWQTPPPRDGERPAVAFDTTRFPHGEELPLELLAQQAVWRLPFAGLLDRPGPASAYRCDGVEERLRLFTSRLGTRGRLLLTPGTGAKRALAEATYLRAAISRGQTYAAASDLVAALETAETPDAAALLADRLLLAWRRLLAEGKLIEADRVLAALLRKGRHHPLSQKMDVLALAASVSREWQAQLRGRGRPEPMKVERLRRAGAGFARWAAWSLAPAGRMLHAKVLVATGQLPAARKVLARLSREPYDDAWRRCALLELATPATADQALLGRRRAVAAAVAQRGRMDGRLEEDCWRRVAPVKLRAPGARASESAGGPAVQVVRSVAGFVLFAFRLPRAPGRHWRVTVAIDADRDAWTQVLLQFDTRGRQSAGLALRHGPTADLGRRGFQLVGNRAPGEWTFELAVPLHLFATRPPDADLWSFQVRATAREMTDEETPYYFQAQDDPRLLPERYGLLKLPAAATPAPPATGPARDRRKGRPSGRERGNVL